MCLEINLMAGALRGTIAAPPSKSAAHRALICAALADAPTRLRLPSVSGDISATLACLSAMGAGVEKTGDCILISPAAMEGRAASLPCHESGSTLRFLLPLAAACLEETTFFGSGRLPDRPIAGLQQTLSVHGAIFSEERLPFKVSGRLLPGRYAIAGDVSSQYISGLLFALPLLSGDSEIVLISPLYSAPYVELTLEMLARFGVQVQKTREGYLIPGNQRYRTPGALEPEGDWSSAAPLLVAGALGGDVTVSGLKLDTKQGDRAVLDILVSCGAGVEVTEQGVRVFYKQLRPFSADVSQTPDLLPTLAVLANGAQGSSLLFNASRLRFKESDRLMSTAAMLTALGGKAREEMDSLEISGTALDGGRITAFNDHRIVMASAVAATTCRGETRIDGAEAVEKSYPAFFMDFQRLGGRIITKGEKNS